MKIGLFFGSFNPIHIGHLILAEFIHHHTELQEIWFVVSPQNPFKKSASLLAERQRLYMVQEAISECAFFKAIDIEFSLPKPNYTIVTLGHLKEKYPNHEFSLIMGADNRNNLHKWRSGDFIAENFRIFVYPRLGSNLIETNTNTFWVNAPIIELSSSGIRHDIANGRNPRFMLHYKTWQYIEHNGFYK